MSKSIIVLAYSGGLDTTFCIPYLKENHDCTLHAVYVNTGGQTDTSLQELQTKAFAAGADSFELLDGKSILVEKVVKYLIFGNVLKQQTYPLSVSAERVVQAYLLGKYASEIGADFLAHGSTGAGNDQIRFDGVVHALFPQLKIITPIRDQGLSRQTEIQYLEAKGLAWTQDKPAYSVNKGLWGTTIGGKETLSSHLPLPDAAYGTHDTNLEPKQISIQFLEGVPVQVSGLSETGLLAVIEYLNTLGESFGIGRDTHVGDTIMGLKGRVAFEAPAATLLIKAHHLLEKHTLTKWQLFLKEQFGPWYGQFLHEGQYFEPVMRNLEAFLIDSQKRVSGTVHILLKDQKFQLLGIESEFDLMQAEFGKYGEENSHWTAEDVKGFTKIQQFQQKVYFKTKSEPIGF